MHDGQSLKQFAIGLILATALLLAPQVAVAKERNKPIKLEDWKEYRTQNFTINSNSPDSRTRKIAVSLERFRHALERITTGLELDSQIPTRMFVFKNERSYTPYKLDSAGEPQSLAGYFLPGKFGNIITLDATAGSDPMRVVYHEFFHAVMKASLGDLPLWLNEGLAEYYSTFEDRGKRVEVGHAIKGHLYVLQGGNRIEWERIFTTNHDSPNYNERNRKGAFYAQSWLIVHYLAADDGRAKKLSRFMNLLRGGVAEEKAFADAFSVSPAELGSAAETYLKKRGSGFVYYELGKHEIETAIETRDVDATEMMVLLGDLLARRGQADAAEGHFVPALGGGASAGIIETARGFGEIVKGNYEMAETHYRKAIAESDVTAEPYALLAGILLDRYAQTPAAAIPSHDTHPLVLEARELLGTAPQPEPGEFNTLSELGRSYLHGGADMDAGVQALERARTLRPLSTEAMRLHACLLARGGQPTSAAFVIERDLSKRDPNAAQRAKRCVADGSIYAAWERVEADDREGAVEILKAARATSDDPTIASRLERMERAVSSGASIVFGPADGTADGANKTVASYNAAVRLAQSGKYDEAITAFEKLLEDCNDERLCESATQTVTELRRVRDRNAAIAEINASVAMANKGDRVGAIKRLRELEEKVTDPELMTDVQEMLRKLGARAKKKQKKKKKR